MQSERSELYQLEPNLFWSSQIGPILTYLFLHINIYPDLSTKIFKNKNFKSQKQEK